MKKILWKLPSFALILLGSLVLIGWWVHIVPLVQIYLRAVPIVINSGVCFLAIGLALLFYCEARFSTVQIYLGSFIVVVSGLTLLQGIFKINLGIDTLLSPVWLEYVSPHPGRMAVNSALAFLFSGLIFILLPFAYKKFIGVVIEILIFSIFLISLLGLSGYLFGMEFFYSIYSYPNMSVLSAIGFLIFSCSFWHEWHLSPFAANWYAGREDVRIIFVSSAIMLTIALIAGLASFLSVAKHQTLQIGHSMQYLLHERTVDILNEIERADDEVEAIVNNELLQQIFQDEVNLKNPQQLQQVLQLFIAEGFSGVEVYDQQRKTMTVKGIVLKKPAMQVKLNLPDHPILMWQDGWYLQINADIFANNKKIGQLRADWPFKEFKNVLSWNADVGETAEVVMCAPLNAEHAECFPSRLLPQVHIVRRISMGEETPMGKALANKIGVGLAYDYRSQRVLAAFSPLATLGLGIVLKVDAQDIYSPIFADLSRVLPLIALAILIGILLLRLVVMPLVRKIVYAEKELLHSNQLLKESQERYDLAVAGSQVGLWDWRIDLNEIFYSDQLKKILGYGEDALPKTVDDFLEYLHPDDLDRIRQAIETHLEKHVPYSVEYRLRDKSGNYRWVQTVGQALWDTEGRAVRMAGSIVDITERKRNQQHDAAQHIITRVLSESLTINDAVPKVLRAICDGMNWEYGAIWMVDENMNRIINIGDWSRPLRQLDAFKDISRSLELVPEQGLPGKVWSSAKPLWVKEFADVKEFPRAAEFAAAGFHFAFCFPLLLGYKVIGVMEFFSFNSSQPDKLILKAMEGFGPQIGQFFQRKAVENQLRESETQKSAILEAALDSILTIDDHGIIMSCNAQTESMFGYSMAELVGKSIDELTPELMSKINLSAQNYSLESVAVRSDSRTFPSELNISGMVIENEHYYVAIVRDVTERKKIEALKNEFVSVVSHELRTPLTSIRGSLALILGGAVGGFADKAKKLLDIAYNNCERLLLLINDILDIEKIEAGKMNFTLRPLDLNEIVVNAIDANQMYAEKFGVHLELTAALPGIKVNVDPDRLTQVLTNLISNAAKFSPENSLVSIAISCANGKARVSVTDKGQGIPEEFKGSIFQKFSQADTSARRAKKGTGLGLSISKMIVEKFDGELNFISALGEGSTFYFDLPLWEADKLMEPTLPRLLICEDDKGQADYLQALLDSAGYATDVAYTAGRAKELLCDQHYDALLLDLILPDQDGISLIRELRAKESTHNLPIIVVSVMAEAGRTRSNGDIMSVVDWLDKPLDLTKLLKAINLIKIKNGMGLPTVLHVEDDEDVRAVIAEVLNDEARVVGASSVKMAKEKLSQTDFDLVVLDLLLPDGNGVELLPLLSQKHLPVIVFSSVDLDREYAQYVSQVLVKSTTSNDDLLKMIKKHLKKLT